MSDYAKKRAELERIVKKTRAQLSAKGFESRDIAAGLMLEALIEMYGLQYGNAVLHAVCSRCIGYGEELMSIAVVESFRKSGNTGDECAKVEQVFADLQGERLAAGRAVIEQAARAVTEKYGEFPTEKDLIGFPRYTRAE